MSKKVFIPENSLQQLRACVMTNEKKVGHDISMPNDDFAAKDEYVIGAEGGNNDFFHLEENIELEVNSDDVNLDSFKKRKTLPPKIWDDETTLNSRVRLKLLDIADDFWDSVELSWVKPKGIHLTGSICNYNWSSYSDIDLHIVVDFDDVDERTDFVQEYFDSKKNEWNEEHDNLTIYGYKVELYVENIDADTKSGGIYDLEENKWIKEPDEHEIEPIGLNKYEIKDKAAKIMTKIDDLADEFDYTDDKVQAERIGDKALQLIGKLKDMRTKGLDRGGESDPLNIVYKVIKRSEYIDKLWDIVTKSYDKINSINESKILREYLEKEHAMPLYKYLLWAKKATDCEKAQDLAYTMPCLVEKYIKKYDVFNDLLDENGEFDDGDDYNIDKFLKRLSDKGMCSDFVEKSIWIAWDYYRGEDLPTWCTTDLIGPVKNEWCIHFTNDADSIAREGFTGGTDDMTLLAYTGAGRQKRYEGYNFAFKINDRNVDYNEYGDEAVIFQASGVEIYHHGDQQRQVIFWGPSVKNIIPIHQENGDWVVYGMQDQILKAAEKPSGIVKWALENLPQYRKQIMAGKNGFIPKRWSREQNKYVPARDNL